MAPFCAKRHPFAFPKSGQSGTRVPKKELESVREVGEIQIITLEKLGKMGKF
jgi:hypothetical protein